MGVEGKKEADYLVKTATHEDRVENCSIIVFWTKKKCGILPRKKKIREGLYNTEKGGKSKQQLCQQKKMSVVEVEV